MTPEENGMVSLVELRQEVAALDTASVQDARARLDKFLSQFGDGKYCEICYRDNNDYFTQEAEYNVFGARHTFYHDDYKGHKFQNNEIMLPLPFEMYVNGKIHLSISRGKISMKRVFLKAKSQKKVEKNEPILRSDIKTYHRLNFDDLDDLREALINVAPFLAAYTAYLKSNKVEIERITSHLNF